MQGVLRKLEEKGVDLATLRALEVFGGNGTFHTKDFGSRVATLQVWENDARLQTALERNLPGATIRIVDSFSEMKRTNERFDLIVVDNPMSTYNGHCEHFDLFPAVFRIASDDAILILDVIPSVSRRAKRRFPYLFNEEQLARRREFYKTNDADDIDWGTVIEAYRRYAKASDFAVEWSFTQQRHFIHYLSLKIKRVKPTSC